jgi:Xaa-Pro dipeptidase
MANRTPEPKIVRPDDIDPHHRWDRPLQAPGHTQVDFEERVNFRRLHDYRLARTRAALAKSGLGALLCFDQHDIRYTTSTVIGEWARDKLTRYSLLTGNGDPYISRTMRDLPKRRASSSSDETNGGPIPCASSPRTT